MSRKYTIAESKERNKYIHIAPNLYIRSGKVVYKKCFVNPEGKSPFQSVLTLFIFNIISPS